MGEQLPFRPPESHQHRLGFLSPVTLSKRLKEVSYQEIAYTAAGFLAAAGILGGLTGLGIADITHNIALKATSIAVLGVGILSSCALIWGLQRSHPHPDDK
jgi:hypothetical protein